MIQMSGIELLELPHIISENRLPNKILQIRLDLKLNVTLVSRYDIKY